MDPYKILIKPHLTEKSMNAIDHNNEITYVVLRTANRTQIKDAFEQLFDVKVEHVNSQINSRGIKIAYLKLTEEHSAEDLAVKMGVF